MKVEPFGDKVKEDGCPPERKETAGYWPSCYTCPLKDCGQGWKDYRIKRTKALLLGGVAIEEIAKELKVSVRVVRGYISS